MRIVDSHCHASPVWYEPVESLLHQMDRNGVECAVLIQIRGQADNTYQEECVRRYPDRLVSVVVVDTARADASVQLQRLVERGARGLRLWADSRSPGGDPLLIWRKAAELGLPDSCGGTAAQFASDAFAELVGSLPDLRIVVEHLGSVNNPTEEVAPLDLRRKVFGFVEPIPPLLDLAWEAFGPRRLMWGSDYPPVSNREGYANALRLPTDRLASRSDEDRALVFGGTAASVFRIDG